MKIEKVVRKDDENVIVYLENQEKLFLSYEVFLKNRLNKDMEISEDGFSFLVRENQKYYIRKKAVDFLGRRLHSYTELKLKLMRKKYEKELVAEVLDDLREKKQLDDYQFGKQYAEEKVRLKAWGRNKLRAELFRKGISPGIVEKVLSEEVRSPVENALMLAEKKLKTLSARNYDKSRLISKLNTYLYSKGYDYDIIKEVIDRLVRIDDSI